MGDTPNTDWTRTIAWQAAAAPAHFTECHKMALQQQQELLQDAQERMAAWAKRRQAALETGIDALTRMSACKTPIEMAAIYGEWMSGSITRILADFDDAQAHTAKMAKHVQKASRTLLEPPHLDSPADQRQPAMTEVPTAREQLREAAD